MYFDPQSGVFGSYRLDGRARTLFIPDKPMNYWKTQIEKVNSA